MRPALLGFGIAALAAWLTGQPPPTVTAAPPAADTVRYAVLIQGNPAGEELAWQNPAGEWRTRFQFNDRGRGPELETRLRLGPRGVPVALEVSGVNYLKSEVAERFVVERRLDRPLRADDPAAFTGAEASWRNQAEDGRRTLDGPALYVPFNGTPLLEGLGAGALVRAEGRCLPLLPAGRACIERLTEIEIEVGPETTAVLYAISGLGFSPQHVWLDEAGSFFASAGGWTTVIREGHEAAIPELQEAERTAEARWLQRLAEEIPERPAGPLAITGARLFDPRSLDTAPGTTVLVEGERIAAVGRDGAVPIPADARVIDAAGRTLLPGLFDMHVHLSPPMGALHLAAGVTTARDLANDVEALLATRQRIEEGTLIGPRLLLAGFMDGPGPYAGPTKALVDTEEEIVEWIERYAELGYQQIKVYSSIDTELVPFIVREAHARGLRVSGHIPAFMTAEQAVRAGFDEIQHANMLFLNFLGDTLDTRTPLRFTSVARHGAALDLASDSVRAFLRLLKERDVVADPTVAIFENMFTARQGTISPLIEPVAGRMPPQVRRGYLGGGLPVPPEMDQRYRDSFRRMLDLVAALHAEGIRIVPGTDALAGFAYQRELELYEEAGIPAAEVLRLATLGSAEVAGLDDELGTVEPGKRADLVLVDGDPTARISDIRAVRWVVKDGVLYDPGRLLEAMGVSPGG